MNIPVAVDVQADTQIFNDQQRMPSQGITRILSRTTPQQSGGITSSNSNRTVRFLLEANGFLDGKASYVTLNADMINIDNTAGNVAVFNSYTECWLKRVSILTNNNIPIEQIDNYYLLAAQMRRDLEDASSKSYGKESLNIFDITDAVEVANVSTLSKANRKYVIELRLSGFLKSQKYIALKALAGQNSSSFSIELEFCAPGEMITAFNGAYVEDGSSPYVGSVPGYQLSNIEFMSSQVFDQIREAEIMESIKSVPIVYHFRTYKNSQSPVEASTRSTINITEFQASIVQVTNTFITNTRLNNQLYDQTVFENPSGPLKSMQVKIGSQLFPAQPLPCSGDAGTADMGQQHYEYIKCMQKNCKYERGFNEAIYSSSGTTKENKDLILATDLRVYEDDVNGDARYIDYTAGTNTKNNPMSIQLLLEFVTAPTNNTYSCINSVLFDSQLIVQYGQTLVLS